VQNVLLKIICRALLLTIGKKKEYERFFGISEANLGINKVSILFQEAFKEVILNGDGRFGSVALVAF